LDVEIRLTPKILVFSMDNRSLTNIAWCAVTYGINRLYWIDGYILCLEVYEKAFEHEIKTREFPVSQVCYTKFPKYEKTFEVEKGVKLPIVNVSEMRIFRNLLKAILDYNKEENCKECEAASKEYGSEVHRIDLT